MRREELEYRIQRAEVNEFTKLEEIHSLDTEYDPLPWDLPFINKKGKADTLRVGEKHNFDKTIRKVVLPDGSFASVYR